MDALPEGALLLVLSYAAPIQYVSDAPMPWQPGLSTIAAVCKSWRALSQRLAVQQVIFCAQSDAKVASFSDWLQKHAPQLSGVSLYNPWQLRGPCSDRPLAALAAAATSSAAAGTPLRLRRLVLDVVQEEGGTAHEVVARLLGAVPNLRHLHLRLLPDPPPRSEVVSVGRSHWNSDTLSPLLGPLRHLTSLTSLVLEGPQFGCQQRQQQQEQQQEQQGSSQLQQALPPVHALHPDPWVAELCAALPTSLRHLQWATLSYPRQRPCHTMAHSPFALGHLTGLVRLALSVKAAGVCRVRLTTSVLQALSSLQQLELTMRLPKDVQHVQRVVHWGLDHGDYHSERRPRALAVLGDAEQQLPVLRSMDLSPLCEAQYLTLDAMQALGSSAQHLTRLHVPFRGVPDWERGDEAALPQILASACNLRCLGLDVIDTTAPAPLPLGHLLQLTQLEVHVAGSWRVGHSTPGLWPAAIAPLTQLQVLSVSAQLLATEEPWLVGLSQLVVLELLPWGYRSLRLRDTLRSKVVQHVRQAAVALGSALQLVLVTPQLHVDHDVRADLQEGAWPSKVTVFVGKREWLAAAGREARPPQLWRVLEGPVLPTGRAHHWWL